MRYNISPLANRFELEFALNRFIDQSQVQDTVIYGNVFYEVGDVFMIKYVDFEIRARM